MNGGDRRRIVLLSAALVTAAIAGALCGCEDDDDDGRTVTTQVLADGSAQTVETRVFTRSDGTTATQITSIVSSDGGPSSTQTWVSTGSSLSPGHVTQSNGEYIVELTDPSGSIGAGTMLSLGGGDSLLALPGGFFVITNLTFDPPTYQPPPATNVIEEPGQDIHLWIGAP